MYTYPILKTTGHCHVKRVAELPELGELRAFIHPVQDEPRGLEVVASDESNELFIVSVPSNGAEHLPVNPFVFRNMRGNVLLSRLADSKLIGVTEEDLAQRLNRFQLIGFWE